MWINPQIENLFNKPVKIMEVQIGSILKKQTLLDIKIFTVELINFKFNRSMI